MRLGKLEREILSLGETNARISTAEISRRLNVRLHRVHYAMGRLREGGVSIRPFVDVFRLGYLDGALFFSIRTRNVSVRRSLLKYLSNYRGVSWLSILTGEFQYGLVLHAEALSEFDTIIEEIETRSEGGIIEKSIAFRTSFYQFPRKYISDKKSGKTLHIKSGGTPCALSEVDVITLRHLTTHFDLSMRDRAKDLGIALSTLQYRIQSLSERGIIRGWFYYIPDKLLEVASFKLLIFLTQGSHETYSRLTSYIERHPNYTYCMKTLGSWDFEAGIECPPSVEASDLVNQLYEQFGSMIRSIRVLGEGKELKYSLFSR